MSKTKNGLSTIKASMAVALLFLCGSAQPPAQEEEIANPVTGFYAMRGLTQTHSAEALGEGRLSFSLQSFWYRQRLHFPNVPNVNADILTGFGACSFGINQYVDIFGSVAGFSSINYTSDYSSGLGAVNGGIQGSLPLAPTFPMRLAAQFVIYAGTAANQINSNNADGFNYFETRTGYDFVGKLLETFIIREGDNGVKIHLNQGIVSSLEREKEDLGLFALGIQWEPHRSISLGVEANSRTFLKDPSPDTDPLWVTPSVFIRTRHPANFYVGSDISLSQERSVTNRALETFRLFGGLVFTFDLLAPQRQAARERERNQAEEKAALEGKVQNLQQISDSIARKIYDDSLAFLYQKEQAQRHADSLAQRIKKDSIMLKEIRGHLEEERSKRTDVEKQLLSTGLLILDAVFFDFNKTEISRNSKPYLTIIGKMLAKYPKLQLEVAGHTDNIGNSKKNLQLSQARAESVRMFLVSITPSLESRLFAKGYGPSQPKADNRRAEGRKMNRRVELQVLNKDVLREYNQ